MTNEFFSVLLPLFGDEAHTVLLDLHVTLIRASGLS